jgi:hypothetical protein
VPSASALLAVVAVNRNATKTPGHLSHGFDMTNLPRFGYCFLITRQTSPRRFNLKPHRNAGAPQKSAERTKSLSDGNKMLAVNSEVNKSQHQNY